tara:strand:- start:257 stop:433 length:177 start_codon:yes stop_codon:yes gene_type:complete
MSLSIGIGNKVKVIDQEITGTIVDIYNNLIIISDDNAETDDDRLEFHIDDLITTEEQD